MNERSRGKRNLPAGLISQGAPERLRGREYRSIKEIVIPGRTPRKKSESTLVQKKPSTYMISSAYAEPLGFDMVENIVLQREYIID